MKQTKKAIETRQERYKKRVDEMIKRDFFNVYFITFTFSDAMLNRTSAETRKRYIKEWLKEQASEYLLNKDYGEKNEREHYHALIISRYKVIVIDAPQRHNVFINAKKISRTINNFRQSRQQISKDFRYTPTIENLTAHAFKETTKGGKIIYSRCNCKVNKRFKALADAKLKAYRESEEGKRNKELFKIYVDESNKTAKNRAKIERELLEKYNINDA